MSYIPDLDANGMLSSLGANIANNVKQYRQKQLLSDLGKDLMGGDYNSAASKALAAGDMGTGLKLLELGRQRQMDSSVQSLLGGLGGPAQTQQHAPASPQMGDGSGGDYFKKLAQVESGGNPNAVSPTGARGMFQFIPSTWKQYGGGADVRDPQAQFVAVQKLTADNRNALAQALGREPTAGELYLAHQQGAGGAIKLLSNPSATPAELGLGRNVAVNGGNPNAPAGQFVQKWTSKFDGVGSPLAFGASDQATAPSAVAYARPPAKPAAPASEDDGEEDKPAAAAQVAQGALPGVAAAQPQRPDPFANITPAQAAALIASGNAGAKAIGELALKRFSEANPTTKFNTISTPEQKKAEGIDPNDPRVWQKDSTGKLYPLAESKKAENEADDNKIKVVGPGAALTRGGKEVYRNQGDVNAAIDDETARFVASQKLAGDTRAMIGWGRGAQGANNLAKINKFASEMASEQGLTAQDLLARQAEQQGLNAQQRTFGTQTARMSTSSVEAQGAITLGRQASAVVPRGNWVPVNKAIQAFQNGTSDPALGKFAAANLAIINTYARAINPNGQPTVADKEHAREMLNTAMGPDKYNAVLDQMQQEIDMAHNSPAIAKRGLENIRKGKPFMDGINPQDVFGSGHGTPAPSNPSQPSSAPSGTTKSGVKWSIEQ